jgi:hypothetical protein
MMAVAIEVTFARERPLCHWSRPAFGLLYLSTLLFSVAFSFAFWWSVLAASNTTNTQIEDNYGRVTGNIKTSVSSVNAASSSMSQLAGEFSEKQIKEAYNGGGSCAEGSGTGDGPIARLRQEHANLFKGEAKNFGDASSALSTLADTNLAVAKKGIDQLPQAADREALLSDIKIKLTEVITNAETTISGMQGARQGIADIGQGYSGATPFPNYKTADPSDTIKCTDSAAKALIDRTLNAIDSLPSIDAVAFTDYRGATATDEAISRFFNAIGLGWIVPGASRATLAHTDLVPLVISLFVDFFLLAVGLLRIGMHESAADRIRRRAQESAALEEARSAEPKRRSAERLLIQATIRRVLGGVLDDILVSRMGWQFFVAPAFVEGEQAQRMQPIVINFLEHFEAKSSPLFEFRTWSLPLLRLFHDAQARRLLRQVYDGKANGEAIDPSLSSTENYETDSTVAVGQVSIPAKPNIAVGATQAIDWSRGSHYRWFRISRDNMTIMIAALEAVEDALALEGDDPFKIAKGLELQQRREQRDTERMRRKSANWDNVATIHRAEAVRAKAESDLAASEAVAAAAVKAAKAELNRDQGARDVAEINARRAKARKEREMFERTAEEIDQEEMKASTEREFRPRGSRRPNGASRATRGQNDIRTSPDSEAGRSTKPDSDPTS